MTSDNEKCIKLVQEIMEVSSMFGYGEVNAHNRFSTMISSFKKLDNPKFRHYVLKENRDVYRSFKSFFHKN